VRVDLHEDFVSNVARLPPKARQEIGQIVKQLEDDAFYVPVGDDYLVQKNSKGIIACMHLNAWEGWQITWRGVYSPDLPSIIVSLAITLSRDPHVFENLKPSQAASS
jgi:hypothetical protein